MRRWLLILLVILMPAQLVWAAAAPYCGHESGKMAKTHIGHHEHRHQASASSGDAPASESGSAKALDADCAFCHAGVSAAFPTAVPVPMVPAPLARRPAPPPLYVSHVPAGPERPDRLETTATVRIGGSVVTGPRIA